MVWSAAHDEPHEPCRDAVLVAAGRDHPAAPSGISVGGRLDPGRNLDHGCGVPGVIEDLDGVGRQLAIDIV